MGENDRRYCAAFSWHEGGRHRGMAGAWQTFKDALECCRWSQARPEKPIIDALECCYPGSHAPPDEDAVVSDVERFCIQYSIKLGKGSTSTLYAAVDSLSGGKTPTIAAKVVDTRRVDEKGIMHEVNILQMLNHRHIVACEGHGRSADSPKHRHVLFLELADGGDLYELVMSLGGLSEASARTYFIQIVEAVAHCHDMGVAHRDLKLENVVLTGSGEVKLVDFGLAHAYPRGSDGSVDRSVLLQDACGSMAFAAPEVGAAAGYDGFAADLWSLGVCLFAMLTGSLPFAEASESDPQFADFERACSEGKQPSDAALACVYRRGAPRLSPELRAVLDGLLVVDPLKRLSTAELCECAWLVSSPTRGGPP